MTGLSAGEPTVTWWPEVGYKDGEEILVFDLP